MNYILILLIFLSDIAHSNSASRLEVKNNTALAVEIADVGRIIPALTTEQIFLTNTNLWAASEDVDALIDNDTLDIVLSGNVVSNAEAKELIHGYTFLRIKEGGVLKSSKPLELNFSGPNVTVTDNGDEAYEVSISPVNTVVGTLIKHCMLDNSVNADKWLGNFDSNIPGNETLAIMPFDTNLRAVTFSNRNDNVDVDVEIWASALGDGTTKTLKYDWDLPNNIRVATKNDLSISFDVGDKLAIFIEDGGDNAQNTVVCLYFQVRTNDILDSTENFSGNFTGGGS